jgi:plasmid stabilization system protein ParE
MSAAGAALMELKWTSKALSDLVRLYDILAPVGKRAAARTLQSLTATPIRLLEHPHIGEKLEEFELRAVRRILVGHYKMRY